MPVDIIKGNLFSSGAQTLVNTVNCMGVMGAGVALEFRLRYPHMFNKYVEMCEEGSLSIGKLWIYKASQDKWVLNFPTKNDWKLPSKMEYLEQGLQKFVDTYNGKGIESVAFPLLGSDKGGLNPQDVEGTMLRYLSKCSIPVEIYHYDPEARDELFDKFCQLSDWDTIDNFSKNTGVRKNLLVNIHSAIRNNDINSFVDLSNIEGVGFKTLEKLLYFTKSNPDKEKKIQISWLQQ